MADDLGYSDISAYNPDSFYDTSNIDKLFFHYPHYFNQGGFPGAAIRVGTWKLIERFEEGQVHLYALAGDKGENNDLTKAKPNKIKEITALLHQLYIPKPPQDASFRMPERIMIKAHLFVNGYPIKNRCNDEHILLSHPRRAGLETFYAALLISTRE